MNVTLCTTGGWGRSIGCSIHFAFVHELSTFKLPSCICSLRRFVCDRFEAFRVTGCMSRASTVHLPAFRTFSISNISKFVFWLLQRSLIAKETTTNGPKVHQVRLPPQRGPAIPNFGVQKNSCGNDDDMASTRTSVIQRNPKKRMTCDLTSPPGQNPGADSLTLEKEAYKP